jgi:asparagine synthase (glutamine-hydrolysing)
MCGINGIYAYHAAATMPAEAELLATRDAMLKRGPDGAGVWWSADRRCALANRRLAIQDLSERAAQPMVSADGMTVVTFNGEIYNAPELRVELEAGGACLRTTGDTEVLLHLYARDGAAMVQRLRGMFAFAIWDDRKGALFLARDPYGIKPLYTANDGWTFRFASQVKALLAGGEVSRAGEPAGIVGFHLFGSVPEPFTLYRAICALPAGHTQLVDAAGAREPKPFANLAGILAQGAAHPAPARELPERLRAALFDSARAHLLADVEIGIFLSAGVDSSALLGLVRDAGAADVRAITLAFDEFCGTPDDEAPIAARTAERYSVPHIVRQVGEREFRDDLPVMLAAMDQPSIDGVNTWFVAKAAREAGLKVALSGLGGDELLAGYPSFVDMPRWRRYFGPLAAVPGLGRLARRVLRACAPDVVRRRPKALGLLEYANGWSGTYLLRRGLFLPSELVELLDPDVVREGLRRLKPLRRLAASIAPDPGSDIGRVCALESAHYMRDQLLRDADWAGMANSVEIRLPYVDTRLLAAMAPLMPQLKPGAAKAVLAHTPSRAVPDEIVVRAKTGFGVPTGAWMQGIASRPNTAARRPFDDKGLVSRSWSHTVLEGFA